MEDLVKMLTDGRTTTDDDDDDGRRTNRHLKSSAAAFGCGANKYNMIISVAFVHRYCSKWHDNGHVHVHTYTYKSVNLLLVDLYWWLVIFYLTSLIILTCFVWFLWKYSGPGGPGIDSSTSELKRSITWDKFCINNRTIYNIIMCLHVFYLMQKIDQNNVKQMITIVQYCITNG